MFLAVQAASDSLQGLQRQASALTDVLDGVISGSRVTANIDNLENGFGRLDRGALKPLDIITAATGDKSLRSAGGALDDVKRVLPGIVASVAGERGLSEENLTARVSTQLYSQLGFRSANDAPAEIQKVVNTVIAGLNESQSGGRGVGGFREEVGTDATAYVDKLVAGAEGPFKEVVTKIARLYEENGNRLVDSLAQLHQRFQQIGALYDQLAETRVSNVRLRAQYDADAQGRSSQALDSLSVDQLEAGANYRQHRLTGLGASAFDPKAIGAELAKVRGQIAGAVDKQQEVFDATGGRGPEFGKAADEVLKLKDRAANLQQALKNLADVSGRSAVIQEKLNRLQQEKEGRLGFAEKYAVADPEERLRMNQAAILTAGAAERGDLKGLSTDQARQVIDFLNSTRGVTLTGLKGSPRAEDLKNNLLLKTFPGIAGLTKDQKAEDEALRAKQVGRAGTAEEAIAQLITHQEQGSTEFFNNLTKQQDQFFNRMEKLLGVIKADKVNNQIARISNEKGSLVEKQGPARDLLASVGVTTSPQLDALTKNRDKIEALRSALTTQRGEYEKIDAARAGLNTFSPLTSGTKVTEYLAGTGLNGDQIERATDRYNELLSDDPRYLKLEKDARARGKVDSPEYKAAYDELARKALGEVLASEGARDFGAPARLARERLNGIAGVDAGKIEEQLRDPKKADAFIKALGAFDNGANKLEDFNKKLETYNSQLDQLNKQLADIVAAARPVGPVQQRAQGGSIFQPQGTDTVPAMLTPGEFVVNAKSARANAAALHRINSAKGPVNYLAGGGVVGTPVFLGYDKSGQMIFGDTASNYKGPLAPEKEPLRKPTVEVVPARSENDRPRRVNYNALATKPKTSASSANGFDPAKLKVRDQVVLMAAMDPTGRAAQNQAEYKAAQRQREKFKAEAANRRDAQGKPTALIPTSEFRKYRKIGEQLGLGKDADIDKVKGEIVQRKVDKAAGKFVFNAEVGNFSRLSALNSGIRRPGDEGQKAIAARQIGLDQQSLEKRIYRDDRLSRYFGSKVGRQQVNVRPFAIGGLVNGSGAGDTTPALLTRGEFVMNRGAVSRLGANNVQRLADGGAVAPVSGQPGSSSGDGGFVSAAAQLVKSLGGFDESAQRLSQTFGAFNNSARELAQALNNMPKTLTITANHTVNVNHNGAEVFAKLTPAIEQMVKDGVDSAVTRAFNAKFPDAGVNLG